MEKFACNDTLAESLLEEHKGAIIKEVRRRAKNKNDFDDYRQEAEIEFVRAINTFDPSRNIKFLTYALVMVRNRLITLNKKNYLEKSRLNCSSIDIPCGGEIIDKRKGTVQKNFDMDEFLHRILKNLSKKEKEMLLMRAKRHTFSEIGKKFNITGQRVQQKIGEITKRYENIYDSTILT